MTRTYRLLGALSIPMLAVVGLNLYGCSPGDQAPVGISRAVSNLKATTGNTVNRIGYPRKDSKGCSYYCPARGFDAG